MIHYKNGKCTQVDQSDPDVDQSDPPLDQGDPVGGSQGSTISTQPLQSSSFIPPLDGIDGSKDGSVDGASSEKKPRKPPRRKPKSVLYWDTELGQLRAVETHPNVDAWYAKWGGLLGSQERLEGEIDKANDWLKSKPKAIARTKNFQMFMERWLGKVE